MLCAFEGAQSFRSFLLIMVTILIADGLVCTGSFSCIITMCDDLPTCSDFTKALKCFWGSFVSAVGPFGVVAFGVLSCWVVNFFRVVYIVAVHLFARAWIGLLMVRGIPVPFDLKRLPCSPKLCSRSERIRLARGGKKGYIPDQPRCSGLFKWPIFVSSG